MGWKETLSGATDKVTQSVSQNRGKLEQGIDKAAHFASSKTGGKYDDKIRKGAEQARSGLDKVAASDEPGHPATGSAPSGTADPTPPKPTPPSTTPTSSKPSSTPSSTTPPSTPPPATPTNGPFDDPETPPPAAPSKPV
jgi:hypothetical protein